MRDVTLDDLPEAERRTGSRNDLLSTRTIRHPDLLSCSVHLPIVLLDHTSPAWTEAALTPLVRTIRPHHLRSGPPSPPPLRRPRTKVSCVLSWPTSTRGGPFSFLRAASTACLSKWYRGRAFLIRFTNGGSVGRSRVSMMTLPRRGAAPLPAA